MHIQVPGMLIKVVGVCTCTPLHQSPPACCTRNLHLTSHFVPADSALNTAPAHLASHGTTAATTVAHQCCKGGLGCF